MSGWSPWRARKAAFAVILAVAGGLATVTSPSYAARQQHSDTFSGRRPASMPPQLFAVAASSPANAWAVGTVIEHWDGRKWRLQAGQKSMACAMTLQGVAAVAPSSAWAVGRCATSTGTRALIEHWNGRRWSIQAIPNPRGARFSQFSAVAALSASDAWAVGSYVSSNQTRTLIEHWSGGKWQLQQSGPSPALSPVLEGVAAVSPRNAWAVGYETPATSEQTLIERWNGRKWRVQSSFSPGSLGNMLVAVTAVSGANAWAAGIYSYPSGDSTLIEFWNGSDWSVQSSANPATFNGINGIAATSPTNAWAVGLVGSGFTSRTLMPALEWQHLERRDQPERGHAMHPDRDSRSVTVKCLGSGLRDQSSANHNRALERKELESPG
jgi:hypothetical protein